MNGNGDIKAPECEKMGCVEPGVILTQIIAVGPNNSEKKREIFLCERHYEELQRLADGFEAGELQN